MSQVNRRRFLQSSALLAGGTFAIGGTRASGNVLGANDRIRIAVAGVHGRGKAHLGAYSKMKDVEITYVVDVDSREHERAVRTVEGNAGNRPKAVVDIREALDDPNVDAVSIATPNHWHSLMAIWACQAGKDVYVEKPCSHNVREGRILVETARRYERIVQHGTQGRSSSTWARVAEVIRSGHYGPLRVARGLCYKRRGSIGNRPTTKSPADLDFNLWLGPAQEQPYHANLVHYNWHWFWDFGNGDLGNQGVHQMDVARWGIPDGKLPKSVISVGGRLGYSDQGETANTQLAVFDYGETQLIFEVRGLVKRNEITDMFHFDGGTIRADGRFYPTGSKKGESLPDVEYSRGPGSSHFANFIAAVKSRKTSDLNAEIEEGHYSSALCHLANISYRLGEAAPLSSKTDPFAGNEAATETWEATREHLAENGVELAKTNCVVGRKLEIDPKSETFVGDAEASQLLTRKYRKGFEVPQEVARADA